MASFNPQYFGLPRIRCGTSKAACISASQRSESAGLPIFLESPVSKSSTRQNITFQGTHVISQRMIMMPSMRQSDLSIWNTFLLDRLAALFCASNLRFVPFSLDLNPPKLSLGMPQA
jgi:hypothetical protein